jgi:hypothetical protein
MRDDFDQKTKDILFKRARAKCSNPACRRETSLAHSEADKAVNLGEAAHITAASPHGPRYDASLSAKERKSIHNAIWLCGTCAKLIDSDEPKYTVALLQKWKAAAEAGDEHQVAQMAVFHKLEMLMPALLAEMRKDLAEYPLVREIILLSRSWTYNGDGSTLLTYYYEDHSQLKDKMTILCNHRLLRDITYNNVKRYNIMENLVDYLLTHE